MQDAIALGGEPTRWKRHFFVLAVVAALGGSLSLLLWFHPTAGYAHGGILDGADLRGDLIKIIGCLVLAFGATSTVVTAVIGGRLHATARYALIYGIGIGAAVGAVPLLDKIY